MSIVKKVGIALSLSAFLLQGVGFAADANNDKSPTHFVGSIYFDWNPGEHFLLPDSISFDNNETMYVTTFGDTSHFRKAGQIWSATPNDQELSEDPIVSGPGQSYGQLSGHAVDPDNHDRLFVCSNFIRLVDNHLPLLADQQKMGRNEVIAPPTVVVFERSSDTDTYRWVRVINLANTDKQPDQFCGRLVIEKGYLFALNSYEKDRHYPAISYTQLTDTDNLPTELTVAAGYDQFGLLEQEEGNFVLFDMIPRKQEDGTEEMSLFLLNNIHHAIDHIKFMEVAPGELQMSEAVTERTFSSNKVPFPIAFTNDGDDTFIISSSLSISSRGSLYRVFFRKESGTSAQITKIGSTPTMATALAIGNDRLDNISDPVVFAALLFPVEDSEGMFRYRIDEYRFKD